MTGWSRRYLGIPFAPLGRALTGCDCYGLACVIYQEELAITLPDYLDGYASTEEQGEIAALIAGAQHLPMWVPVDGPAVAFDLAVFRRGRLQTHVGIIVRRGLMLHVPAAGTSRIESYEAGRWRHRLTGIWRHVDLISCGGRA